MSSLICGEITKKSDLFTRIILEQIHFLYELYSTPITITKWLYFPFRYNICKDKNQPCDTFGDYQLFLLFDYIKMLTNWICTENNTNI